MWRTKGGTEICISPAVLLLLAAFVLLSSPLLLAAILSAALLHELGHCAALRHYHARIDRLSVTPFGAEIHVADTARLSYGAEMMTVLAGPGCNLALAAALGLAGTRWETAYLFAGAHLVLGVFNLLPALPLDGGRLLWLAVAWCAEPFTADRVTAAVSLATAMCLTGGGVWVVWRLGGSPFLLLGAVGLLLAALRNRLPPRLRPDTP